MRTNKRWICTSCDHEDLLRTDKAAESFLSSELNNTNSKTDKNRLNSVSSLTRFIVSEKVKHQYEDNLKWIREADSHNLVVGSEARILYSDRNGRVGISLAINKLIREGTLKAPVVLSRDHHDVSGTDSPFRETSNIYDGSAFTADMAVQNFVGDAARGATWVALHNGGG